MKLSICSPLSDFLGLIALYFSDIWDFLIFIGGAASAIVLMVGIIMTFVGARVGKTTGPKLIFGGIVLTVIIVYALMYPPDLSLG